MPDMHSMIGGGAMMGWAMALMFLLPVLLIGLLALLAAQVLRASRPGAVDTSADAPLAILQRRYARGDVGADEYERIRSAITKT